MGKIRILLLEDNPDDVFLVERELKKNDFDFYLHHVETEREFRDALDNHHWDLILADYNLPGFGGPRALEIVRDEQPDLPLVLMSGEVEVEEALQAINKGACDFIQKQGLARLGPVVKRVLNDVRKQQEHRLSEQQLVSSEYKYRTMFETMSQGILYFDMQGGIFSSNPSARKILGLDAGQLHTMTYGDERFRLIQENGEPFDPRQLPAALAINLCKPVRGSVMGIYNQRQGEYRWIRVDVIPQYEQNSSEPGYLYAAIEDITDQKKADANRRKLLEELSQSQKMESVGRLAGGVAHDFNNLLTAIIGNADLAMNTIEPDNVVYDDLREIKTTAERAADLTRQLLAFSRRQIVELKIININNVLLETDKMLRRLIGENIELITLPQQDLWQVKIDSGQLEQVLTNLVVNAQDAMHEGGKVIIETANVTIDNSYADSYVNTRPGDYVMLAVSDNGTGMDHETVKQIFEPFFTTKEKGKGTGLGLSTCYGIIRQNRGNIWVYSEPGTGTTIKVYLPRVTGKEEEKKVRTKTADLPGGTETVLVAEDEPAVRQVISRTLTDAGYTVLEASNGEEALALAGGCLDRIQLLITDVVMPRMGGRELSRKLEELKPGLKVLFISGYTDNAIVHQGILEKGIEFIQKPFQPSLLLKKIRKILD